MRIGLLGGTFDPVHLGHLILAEQCREQAQLDRLWFVPAGQPPHKASDEISSGRDRQEMLQLAIAGHERFAVNVVELERADTSYTVHTLEQLTAAHPDDEFWLILGADSVHDLPGWYQPQRIMELARVLAVNRGGQPLPSREPLRGALGAELMARLEFVTIPDVEISATDIRQRRRNGRSIRYLVPRAVEMYIQEHGLYAPESGSAET